MTKPAKIGCDLPSRPHLTSIIWQTTLAILLVSSWHNLYATVGANTPFISYEGEAGTLGAGATAVSLSSPPLTQYSSPELEASGHAYARLNGTGQYVEWTNNSGQAVTAINVRECIPDAAGGGGITASLNLYVDGVYRQTLTLNSMQTWLYENSTNYNGNDQSPADGSPRVFFDDVHTFINGAPVAPGGTIRLQKDATNSAAFYYIDVVDLEAPPAPAGQPTNSLSITSYGAVANDTNANNANAIQNCINDAQTQGKSVWIPPGTFYVTTFGGLNANGITIEGAGMWYSRIYRKMPIPNATPLGAIFNLTSCTVRNFALDANATSRATVDGCGGAMDTSGVNWLADSIWTQHTMSGFWASGTGGRVQNCRLLSIWADGINLNNVSLGATVGNNLTSSNNFIRGTGDDAHAINSVNYNENNGSRTYYTRMANITVVNNTSIAPWGGKGQAIYGGTNQVVMNNLMSDTARYIGLGVGKFGVNGSDLDSATVVGNTVVRCGGNGYLQQQAAMHIGNGGDGQGVGTVANAYCASNAIVNSLYDGVGFSTGTNIVFQRNSIISPGRNGMVVGPQYFETATGFGIVNSNLVSGLGSGNVAFTNLSSGYVALAPIAASAYDNILGASAQPCVEGGSEIGGIDPGDWVAYNNLNFNGANAFVARVSGAGAGGSIQIHLDSYAGPIVGTCAVPPTGSAQNYRDVFCSVTNTSGVHIVYLVFAGSGGNLFNLEFFGFFAAPPAFSHQLVVGNTYSLNSQINGKFVSADNGGTNALIAKSSTVGATEQFQIVDAGGGNIALLAVVNQRYVSADNGGASPLIANRTGVGSWETFTEFDAGNGAIALRAQNDGKYVNADNGGASPLIANSSALSLSTAFVPGFVTGQPPATPQNVAAISGNSQVAITWLAASGATGYNVKRSTTSGTSYTTIASNITTLSFTNTGLTIGTTYYYVVSAQNPAGESTNSQQVTATFGSLNRAAWVASALVSDSGGPPANALDGNINTRWATGTPQVNGQWFQVDMAATNTFYKLVLDAGSSSSDYPRGYQVNVSNDGLTWSAPLATGSGSSAVTIITVPTNSARYIRVTQTGSVGGLWWSIHEFNVLGNPGSPAGIPTGLTATSGDGNVTLRWNAATNATGYNVKQATASNGPYADIATAMPSPSCIAGGLSNGIIYYFVVSATNEAGESANSTEVSARPVSGSPPQLSIEFGSTLQFSWPVDHIGWRLETQTHPMGMGLGTNWMTVLDSEVTNRVILPIDATNGSAFFRLSHP